MGGDIEIQGETVFSRPSSLSGTVIDAAQIPDLVPILAVAGAAAKGETRIVHAQRLRIKESDRLAATAAELAKMLSLIHIWARSLTTAICASGRIRPRISALPSK